MCACGCKEDFEIIRILNELKFLFVFQWNNFILYIVFYSLRFFSLIYKNFFTPPLGLSWNKRFWLYKRKCSRYFRRVSFPQREYQILNIALTKLFFFHNNGQCCWLFWSGSGSADPVTELTKLHLVFLIFYYQKN